MTELYDLVGVGFGPSNLAIAVAAEEMTSTPTDLKMLFFDNKADFSWHPGMLLETSRLQVVFLKDLVTMRNPRSKYSFLNYLHYSGRLHEFINLRTFYPTRIEFDQYYHWVSKHFNHLVRYRHEVVSVEPYEDSLGEVNILRVKYKNLDTGKIGEALTKHLIFADGGKPKIPNGVRIDNKRVFHSSDCLYRLDQYYSNNEKDYHFIIVGSGQTAADILYYLINRYPHAKVTTAMREFAFKPQDDTHFVNQLFFPDVVNMFYSLPEEKRNILFRRHSDVTHSAADIDLLPLLYDAVYQDKVTGANRIQFKSFSELVATSNEDDRASAIFRNVMNDTSFELSADAIILATGYERKMPIPLLSKVDPWLEMGEHGYDFERFYAIRRKTGFHPRIYPLGYCEQTHGFSEVLLSLLPLRSQEVLEDIMSSMDKEATGVLS